MPETSIRISVAYFRTLTRLLRQPGRFFDDLPVQIGWRQPLWFLLLSGLFSTGACLAGFRPQRPILMGGILLINAVGMTGISAGVGYCAMVIFMGRQASFARFFSVYAFASGVVQLAAWVPFFVWLTEPWKWWLIGTGLKRGLGFKSTQTVLIIGASIGVVLLFFGSVLSLMSMARGTG